MNKLKKWTCPRCGKLNTKYTVLCESCMSDRGFLRWLFVVDNVFLYICMSVWILVIICAFLTNPLINI